MHGNIIQMPPARLPTRIVLQYSFRLAALISLGLLLLAIWMLYFWGGISVADIEYILRSHPIAAPVIFVIAHVIAAAAFLPCSAFTLLAGLFWPQPYALGVSIVAALCASCTTFMLGRHLGKYSLVPESMQSAFGHFIRAFSNQGWKMVAFAHLNPVLPSSTLGYAFGLSAISFRTYAFSALFSMLPLQLALVTIGGSARESLLTGASAATASLAVSLAAFALWFALKAVSRKWSGRKES